MSEDELTCESCHKRRAAWHLTDFVDGRPVQQHLCEECYADKEGGSPPEAAFARLIAAMVPELKEMATRTCPACGIDYLEFRQHMKLGCPRDYEVFEKPLQEWIERIHGATRHEGKAPSAVNSDLAVRRKVRSLRRRQERAIDEEDYELAAALRDRIRELQQHDTEAPEE